MLKNAEFIKGVKSSRLNTTPNTSRPSTVKDRAADRYLGLARRVNIPTNKRDFNTDKPLVAPAPTNVAVSSKGSVPVNPKAVMKERNQAQIDSLQKKEYLKTYLKDGGSGTTLKPETVTRAKYKINSERKEVPVDRPIVNLDGTVTSRTEPKVKREKPLTQEELNAKKAREGEAAGVKRSTAQQRYEQDFPRRTVDDVINDNVRKKVETKRGVANAETQRLRDKYSGDGIPLVTPAVNYVANKLIDREFGENEIRGTLAAAAFTPLAAGLAYNQHRKNKEAEEKKQAQAQAHRDKVAEIIARRNLIREQRGIDPDSLQQQQAERNRLDLEEKRFDLEQKKLKANQQPEQELQPRLGYNYFNKSVSSQANFSFLGLGRKPEPQGGGWKKAAAIGVGGYGLLAGINKKRNEDALRINKIKDKEDRAAALDYYNSAQYNVDNLLSNVPIALGLSRVVPDTLAHPLIAPAPDTKEKEEKKDNKPRWTNYRTQAAYSKPEPKQNADFFLPLIVPALSIAGASYGLYRRRKEAQKKDEILQAEQLAALDRIQDPELRSGLLSKARGQLIDDTSRSQLVDSALSGDYKSALGIGLKKINFDSK